MHHFFVTKEQVSDGIIRITGSDVNHLKNVLRVKPGEEIAVSDGENRSYRAALSSYEEGAALFSILEEEAFTNELPAEILLFQGLPKGDKLEWITEKAVELGVSEILPVAMHRSVAKWEPKKAEKKTERLQAIAESAAKQAGRKRIPAVSACLSVPEMIDRLKTLDAVLVPYECAEGMEETRRVIGDLPKTGRIGVVIGPEGGFTKEEIGQLEEAGGRIITLGKRILRTETAGLYVLSVLGFLWEA